MPTHLRILGGKIHDPANGVSGVVRELLIADGRVVDTLPANTPTRTIDATGMVVMPGGVDIHCHIASSSVNRARAMSGEEHANHVHACDHSRHLHAGSGTLTPATTTTGYRYASLGYTAALEAAVAPSAARHTHLELHDTPNIDAGFLLLLANHQRVIELLDRGDQQGITSLIGEMLRRTAATGIKVVNPGGVAAWRGDATHHTVALIDEPLFGKNGKATPRAVLEAMCSAAEALGLAHAPHVHCNRLGLPGNVSTTLETLRALDGRRVHLTHLQFHAYGATHKGDFTSGAQQLTEWINAHPTVTADVGQVVFGDAFTLTGDTPLEHLLWKLTGSRYVSIESELESGCGLMPLRYSDKSFLHSLQWAVGMELLLTASDPWRMLLSTDHPNGGSFLSYPAIIAALMSRAVREETIRKLHPRALRRSRIKDLTREMTLDEIAVITRAGPARVLGWSRKGHLGVGADADITIYHDRPADPKTMFESPRYVIKSGTIVVEDGELRAPVTGRLLFADLPHDPHGDALIRQWFDAHGSYDVAQFGLHPSELAILRAG